jgi:diaminopimelate decarboxylase/aspartate kinase
VVFTPSFAPRAEYDAAFARGVNVTVDSIEALQRWPETFRGRALWLRLDLGRGDGHHEKVCTGGAEAKFGLPAARAQAFAAEARQLDARIVALHAHLGSGIDNPAHWREVHADLAGLAEQIGTVDTLDIGGGLPVPYAPDARPFDLEAWRTGLEERPPIRATGSRSSPGAIWSRKRACCCCGSPRSSPRTVCVGSAPTAA